MQASWLTGVLARRLAKSWALPGALLLGVLIALNMSVEPPWELDYPPAASASAAQKLFLIAPFCAALAAIESGRLSRAGIWRMPAARRPVIVALQSGAPALTLGAVGLASAFALASWKMTSLPRPDWRIMGIALLLIVGYVAIGHCLGRLLPAVAAAPLAGIGVFLWMVYPPSLEPLWVRHLTGAYQCCLIETQPDPGALMAPILVIAGAAFLGVSLLVRRPGAMARVGVGSLVAVSAFGLAVLLVRDLGWAAVQPREAELVCQPGAPEVCAWPERRTRLSAARPTVENVVRTLAGYRVDPPERVSEDVEDAAAWHVSLGPSGSPDFIASDLVASAIASAGECSTSVPEPGQVPGSAAAGALGALLSREVGVEAALVAQMHSSNDLQVARSIAGRTAEERRAWVARAMDLSKRCWIDPASLTS